MAHFLGTDPSRDAGSASSLPAGRSLWICAPESTVSQAPSALTSSGLALFFMVERLLVGPLKRL